MPSKKKKYNARFPPVRIIFINIANNHTQVLYKFSKTQSLPHILKIVLVINHQGLTPTPLCISCNSEKIDG